MSVSRRNLMKLSAAGAAAFATAAPERPVRAATGDLRDRVLDHFRGLGFAELPPQDMITAEDFNAGLRYDDTRSEIVPSAWVSIQPAARVDDIALRGDPQVLACFNIVGLRNPPLAPPGVLFRSVMDFFVREVGLDPDRILFVSTELFRPYIDAFDQARVGQFFERPLAEALAAGDGSGFFAPRGHPNAPEKTTVGVYYPVPGAAPGRATAYPPDGFMELGEIDIPPLDGGSPEHEGAGLGLERLAAASGEMMPDFEDSRLKLLRIIEDEAARTGKPLPPGYAIFASL